jgi:hypothetical protein
LQALKHCAVFSVLPRSGNIWLVPHVSTYLRKVHTTCLVSRSTAVQEIKKLTQQSVSELLPYTVTIIKKWMPKFYKGNIFPVPRWQNLVYIFKKWSSFSFFEFISMQLWSRWKSNISRSPPWLFNHKPTKQVSLSVLHWSAEEITHDIFNPPSQNIQPVTLHIVQIIYTSENVRELCGTDNLLCRKCLTKFLGQYTNTNSTIKWKIKLHIFRTVTTGLMWPIYLYFRWIINPLNKQSLLIINEKL